MSKPTSSGSLIGMSTRGLVEIGVAVAALLVAVTVLVTRMGRQRQETWQTTVDRYARQLQQPAHPTTLMDRQQLLTKQPSTSWKDLPPCVQRYLHDIFRRIPVDPST